MVDTPAGLICSLSHTLVGYRHAWHAPGQVVSWVLEIWPAVFYESTECYILYWTSRVLGFWNLVSCPSCVNWMFVLIAQISVFLLKKCFSFLCQHIHINYVFQTFVCLLRASIKRSADIIMILHPCSLREKILVRLGKTTADRLKSYTQSARFGSKLTG